MDIIAVFDGTICKEGGLEYGNRTIGPKELEKEINTFVSSLGRRWGKQEIKNHMKDPNSDKDYADIENVYDHLGMLEDIQAAQDGQAGFLVGFIWGKLYPNPPKDARLKKVLDQTIREMRRAGVLPVE